MKLDFDLRNSIDFGVLVNTVIKDAQEALENTALRIQSESGADEVIFGMNEARIVMKNGKEKEFGTLKTPPRPILYPAILKEKDNLLCDVEEQIRRDIK